MAADAGLRRRILITGAGGFVASHLIEELRSEDGVEIVGVGRSSSSPAGVDKYVSTEIGVEHRQTLERILREAAPDWIFHLVGGSRPSLGETIAANVLTGACLLDAAAVAAPEASVVLLGSAAEYGDPEVGEALMDEDRRCVPQTTYGIAKHAQTRLALAAAARGMCVAVARPFNLLGPGVPPSLLPGAILARAADAAARNEDHITMGNMDAARDFLDVRDAARALRAIAAARARGEVFNVCSGVGTAVSTVAARLLRHFPGIGVRTDARLLRASDPPRVVGNNARIRDALGWTPRIPLERTLEDAYSAFAEARRLA